MKTIVYYSYTGNTKMVAHKIQEKLGCTIMEIVPKIPYTNDYDKLVEDAKGYAKEDAMPAINDIDVSVYDEIILLCPVWWYTYAAPVNTFLNINDLKGKTIYPVATNAGWLGHTFEDIKTLADVKWPLDLVFNNDVLTNEDELDDWLKHFE